jgi:type I restriction enzyme S subunit
MRSDWRDISLGNLFNVKHGFAFKGENFTDTPNHTLLVTPGNFAIGGGFQNPKPKFYSGPVPEDYILQHGQVIVTMTDLSKQSDTLGLAAIVPEDGNTWLHNQRVGLLEFNKSVPSDPRFISYLLRAHEYRAWVVGSATGTTVKHTSPSRIESYVCSIPTLQEQEAIAHVLGTLDDKIELNRQMNETLEAMAQALFKSWFVDFDPVIDKALAAGNPIPESLQKRGEARETLGDKRKPLPAAIEDHFPSRFVFSEEMGWVP